MRTPREPPLTEAVLRQFRAKHKSSGHPDLDDSFDGLALPIDGSVSSNNRRHTRLPHFPLSNGRGSGIDPLCRLKTPLPALSEYPPTRSGVGEVATINLGLPTFTLNGRDSSELTEDYDVSLIGEAIIRSCNVAVEDKGEGYDPFSTWKKKVAKRPAAAEPDPGARLASETLARLGSDQVCKFCRTKVVVFQLEKHQTNCQQNPMNKCRYCHTTFSQVGKTVAFDLRVEHQKVCPQSPYSSMECQFCERTGSTLGSLGIDNLYAHEQECARNPANQCRFCGRSFEGLRKEAAAVRVASHMRRCLRNPENMCRCNYCGKMLRACYFETIEEKMVSHFTICRKRPRPANETYEQPRTAYPVYGSWNQEKEIISTGDMYYDTSYSESDSYETVTDDEFVEATSDHEFSIPVAGGNVGLGRRVELERAKIDHQLRSLKLSDPDFIAKRKGILRRNQLVWHPDKVLPYVSQDPDIEAVSQGVFEYIMTLWDAEQR